ncbi:MAG: hypothetical protein N4A72_05640 [Bacteroidales bacterium]|jgi:hypothetical protein|nr:hypothetical protein [Bacteroidales bacterium]
MTKIFRTFVLQLMLMLSFTVVVAQETIIIGNKTISVSESVLFYDSGGPDNRYGDREDFTCVFYNPNNQPLVIIVKNILLGRGDELTLYNGNDITSSEIKTYTRNNDNVTDEVFITSNADNAITFLWSSNNRNRNDGWEILISSPITYYSYQSGSWNDPDTWTLDPSGTVKVDGGVPSQYSYVKILNGRTVTGVNSQNEILNLDIEEGAVYDMGNFTGNSLGAIIGRGKLRLSNETFPGCDCSQFLSSSGGTVEYYNSSGFTLNSPTGNYNNLIINLPNSNDIVTIQDGINIYGNLNIVSGIAEISAGTDININVDKNLIIDTDGEFRIDQSSNWYYHRLEINGDFTNNGRAILSRLSSADYTDSNFWYSKIDVAFTNSIKDQYLTMNGLTRFGRIEIDKGVDDTYILHMEASDPSNFELFGAANTDMQNTPPNILNPNAFGLLAGTVRVGENVVIPKLITGNNNVYCIDSDAKIWLDGGELTVCERSDNVSAFIIYNKLLVSVGSVLNVDSNQGILLREDSQFIIEGGAVNANVIRTSSWTGVHRGSVVITGGDVTLRGNRYFSGINMYATFTLPYPDNTFYMSGGSLTIQEPTNYSFGNGEDFSMLVSAKSSNCQVTGGVININVPNGQSVKLNTSFDFWDLNISGSNTRSCSLSNYVAAANYITTDIPVKPLNVKNNLNVSGTTFITNNADVTVGKDFNISGAYTPMINSTIFSGTGEQNLNISGSVNGGFNNLKLNNGSETNIDNTILVNGELNIADNALLKGNDNMILLIGDLSVSGEYVSGTTGYMLLNSSSDQYIGGDGTGVLGNIILNKSSGNVILNSDITFSGDLRLAGASSLFDINNKKLSLSATSGIYDAMSGTGTNFNSSKMVMTSGNMSDKGLFILFNSVGSKLFPIGTNGKYTPAEVELSAIPVEYGGVQVKPVSSKPAYSASNNTLDYCWSIVKTGFTGTPSTIFNANLYYDQADVLGNESNYVPGYFSSSNWVFINDISKVNEPQNIISFDGVFDNTQVYTAGEPDAFTAIETYYSRQSGNWTDPNTWSVDPVLKWNGAPAATIPHGSAPVVIGDGLSNNHVVTVDSDNRSAALLYISKGSVLDMGTTTGSIFWSVGSLEGVDMGELKLTTNNSVANFPGGDWGTFLGENGGTVHYYSTGTDYVIPDIISGTDEYWNIIISSDNGHIEFPQSDILIRNSLTKRGDDNLLTSNSQSCNITVQNNCSIENGAIIFNQSQQANMKLNGDVDITSGAALRLLEGRNHTIEFSGNIINNGIIDLTEGANHVEAFVKGDGSNKLNGTGTENSFYSITVDKGTERTNIFTVEPNNFTLDSDLTLLNGTFKLNSSATIILDKTQPFVIPVNAGIMLDGGGAIQIGSLLNNGNNYDLELDGALTILNGQFNVGPQNSVFNNDIVYGASLFPEINIHNGQLNISGQIRRPTSVSMGSLRYNQTGGVVIIRGENDASVLDRPKIEIVNNGSMFNMSNGELHIYKGGGTSLGDVYILPEVSSVTGGKIVLGHTSTPASSANFNLFIKAQVWDIEINGDSEFKTVKQNSHKLTANSLIINNNTHFNTGGLDVELTGDLINRNTSSQTGINQGGYRTGTLSQITSFAGNGIQNITGVSGNSTNFANLTINKEASLVCSTTSSLTINSELKILAGILDDNGNIIDVKGDIFNTSEHKSSASGKIQLSGSIQQNINGENSGIFGSISVNNANGVNLMNDITVNGAIELTNGSLMINEFLLTMTETSQFTGTFGIGNMIVTNGALTDKGVKKMFTNGASVFKFEIGSNGKYTPATINISGATTSGYIRLRPVNFEHTILANSSGDELNYYWSVYQNGLDGATITQLYNYNQSDVDGDESTFVAAMFNGSLWTKGVLSDVDENNNTISFNISGNISGEYTAGTDPNFNDMPVYYSRTSGVWSNPATWSVIGHTGAAAASPPNGNRVIIHSSHTVTANNNGIYAYSVEIGGVLDIRQTVFHDMGFVKGSGTFKIEASGSNYFVFPGGDFTQMMNTTNSTVEYYGTGTLPETREYQNITFSGNGIVSIANNGFLAKGNIRLKDDVTLVNAGFDRLITLNGDWITESTSEFTPGNSRIKFLNTSEQNISVNTAQTFNTIIVDNSDKLNITGANVTLNDKLYIDNGVVTTTTSSLLKMNSTSHEAILIQSDNSFVDGPMQKLISNNDYYDFPVGDNTRKGVVRIFNTETSGNNFWETEYFSTDPSLSGMNNSSVVYPVETVSDNEYWRVKSYGNDKAGVRIRWDQFSAIVPVNSSDRQSKLSIAVWNGSAWQSAGRDVIDNGVNNGSVATTTNQDLGEKFFTISVDQLPTVAVTGSDASVCNDGSDIQLQLSFTGMAPYNFKYTINGTIERTVTMINTSTYLLSIPVADLFAISGTGDYEIKISDVWDASGGYAITDLSKIVTIEVKDTPTVSVTGKTDAYYDEAGVQYRSGSSTLPGNTYSWEVTGGTITNGGGTHEIEITWGNPGTPTASVKLTQTSLSGCSVSETVNVNLTELPTPNVSGVIESCIDKTETYSSEDKTGHTYNWGVTGGTIISGNGTHSVQVKWTTTGANKVILTEEVDGNSVADELNVVVYNNPATDNTITYNSNIILGATDKVTISGTSSNTDYRVFVSATDNAVSAVVNSGAGGDLDVDFTPTVDGEYYILATNSNGCSLKLDNVMNITLLPPFVPDITEDNSNHCGGAPDSFTADINTDYNYKWEIPNCTIVDDTAHQVLVTWNNPDSTPFTYNITVKLTVTHKVSGLSVEVTKDVVVYRTPNSNSIYHVKNTFSLE